MGDLGYDKEYMERKKKLRTMHKKLKNSKGIQEIYHKIMGSQEGNSEEGEEIDPKAA